MIGAIDTSWANPANYTQLLQYGLNEYFVFFPRDIFFALLVTVVAIGIFMSSEGNLKLTFGFLLLADFFLGIILYSGVLMVYCIISAIIGGYILYKTYYG